VSVQPLGDLRRTHAREFGGKAANLGEMMDSGVPVPQGFAICTSDYFSHAARWGLDEALAPSLAKEDWAETEMKARAAFASVDLDPEFTSAVLTAFGRLGNSTVAVRSSALGEDAPDASFAGQYHTELGVSTEEALLDAVRSCWASLWNKGVLEYRHRRSMDHLAQGMGVVVQAMVPATVSGVLFTVDPVASRSDRMLVELVEGPGHSLVSGMEAGVVCRVQRDPFRVVDVDGDGTAIEDHRLEKVWRTARLVEDRFGGPQDIEFGFVEDQLWIFQTRPITTLSPELVEPLEPLRKPTLSERIIIPLAAEHYTTAPKPLDNLAFARLVEGAAELLRRNGGRVTPEDKEAFRSEVWRQAYRLPRHSLTWRALLSLRQQKSVLEKDWTAWWMAGPEPILREVSAPVDLEALSDEALFKRSDAILAAWEGVLGERMVVAGAFRSEFILAALVTLAVGRREKGPVLADLARGIETPVTRSNRDLWSLSRKARGDPRILACVRNGDPTVLETFPAGRVFLDSVEEFLADHGHREGDSWYLSVPVWCRNPARVWSLLSTLVDLRNPLSDPARAQEKFAAARERVERRLDSVPWLRRLFLSLLEAFRAHITFREQSHFDLTRPLAALQEVAAEWGRRLVARGLIPDQDSVFYLTAREVRDWLLNSPPSPAEAQKTLARRRATYQVVNTTWQRERMPHQRPGPQLVGIATSPGVATGTVRLIRGEHQFQRLGAGDILVAPHTNPSWTPLFSIASGVVTEVGGPASHAAVVAREYGIPCVMSVPRVMEILRDGDQVVVDGEEGLVQRMRQEENGP